MGEYPIEAKRIEEAEGVSVMVLDKAGRIAPALREIIRTGWVYPEQDRLRCLAGWLRDLARELDVLARLRDEAGRS